MLTKYSVKRPFTIIVGVIIAIVFGAVALYSMTPDLMPSVNAPYSVVMTQEPGASAEEITADYMVTYYNYDGVQPGTEQFSVIAASNIQKSLASAFGMASASRSIVCRQ